MSATIPHYLLFSEARCLIRSPHGAEQSSESLRGEWHFVLESMADQTTLEVTEEEMETDVERLELWAVIRGLEALDQAAHVTLVTRTEYVQHGFRFGLEEWRENDWQWERFGEMVPVKHADLWRRVDRALRFHRVDCRRWRFDRGSAEVPGASVAPPHYSLAPSASHDAATSAAELPQRDAPTLPTATTRRFDAAEPAAASVSTRRSVVGLDRRSSLSIPDRARHDGMARASADGRVQRGASRWWLACREALAWWFDDAWEPSADERLDERPAARRIQGRTATK